MTVQTSSRFKFENTSWDQQGEFFEVPGGRSGTSLPFANIRPISAGSNDMETSQSVMDVVLHLSEAALAEDWLREEEDEAWKDL